VRRVSPTHVRAKKLKTQRKNIAGGEKGAKCCRLRSFDLIHNFTVFRGETGSLLSARLSFFFSQSRRIEAEKMWKSRAIHPFRFQRRRRIYTDAELALPTNPELVCTKWLLHRVSRDSSIHIRITERGRRIEATKRELHTFLHIVMFIRNLIFSHSMCTLPQECISNFVRYRVYYSLQRELRSK